MTMSGFTNKHPLQAWR